MHTCMQLKLRDFLTEIRSVPNEINMCRICISFYVVAGVKWLVAPLVGSLYRLLYLIIFKILVLAKC